MKYFQLNVNLLLYHHKTTPYTCIFRSSLKTLKTLYLTSVKHCSKAKDFYCLIKHEPRCSVERPTHVAQIAHQIPKIIHHSSSYSTVFWFSLYNTLIVANMLKWICEEKYYFFFKYLNWIIVLKKISTQILT